MKTGRRKRFFALTARGSGTVPCVAVQGCGRRAAAGASRGAVSALSLSAPHRAVSRPGSATRELTFDHVVPRDQGGRTTWENVATACSPCNLKKGGRTPKEAHMQLHVQPIRPTSWQLQEHGRGFPPGYLHESWHDWLYWDVELLA